MIRVLTRHTARRIETAVRCAGGREALRGPTAWPPGPLAAAEPDLPAAARARRRRGAGEVGGLKHTVSMLLYSVILCVELG